MQFLDFDVPLPSELAPPAYLTAKQRIYWGIYQWELELLAREIIINGDRYSKRHLSSWNEVARDINEIKAIENQKWGNHSDRDTDVLYELVRIAHRQFPWQKGFNQPHIALYSRLYEEAGLDAMIHDEYGMSHREMLQLSLSLAGHFLNKYEVKIPLINQINSVDPVTCNDFIKRFSCTLDELKETYLNYQSFGINWAYSFNPLRGKPLIRINESTVICPIPTFLMRRAISEIYYDLVKREPEFSQHFGPAVQSLVGEIANAANINKRFITIPEKRYGPRNRRKDTIDWIIEDETATLFVECKSARVRFQGISDLTSHEYLDAEFERIRSFTLQLYKTLASALRGDYPHWKLDHRPVFPLIVTLEDWQTFGIHVKDLIIDPLKQDLEAIGIDPTIVDKHPPSFCAIDTFDMAINVCNIVGISQVFTQKTAGEYPQWALETFLINHFAKELASRRANVFSDQWLKLMRDREA